MVATAPFIVIEIPGLGLPGTGLTATHPGLTIDTISERPVVKNGEALVPMLFMLRGGNRHIIDEIARRFAPAGMIQTLRRDDAKGIWIGRSVVRENALKDRGVQTLVQFQDRFGAPWVHSEGGVLHLRAVVNDPADGPRLVQQMRGYFADQKVDAQVELQHFAPHDYSVWDELVQFSLGLSTGPDLG